MDYGQNLTAKLYQKALDILERIRELGKVRSISYPRQQKISFFWIYQNNTTLNNIIFENNYILQFFMEAQKKIKRIQFKLGTKSKNNKLLSNLLDDSLHYTSARLSPQYLCTFIYNDVITNNQMAIQPETVNNQKQMAKLRYSHKDRSNINQTSCIMKQSFNLMKQTRKFHLNCIQDFNYKNYHNCKQNNLSQLQNKQYQSLNSCYSTAEIKLKKYQEKKKNKQINFIKQKQFLSQILSNHTSFTQSHRLQKQNYQDKANNDIVTKPKLIKIKSNLRKQRKACQINTNNVRKYRLTAKQNDDLQKQILKETTNDIQYMIRKNGRYLVTPDLSKRVNINKKSQNIQQNKKNKELTKPINFKQKVKNLMISQRIQKKLQAQNFSQTNSPKIYPSNENKYFKKQDLQNYLFKLQDQDAIINKMKFIFPTIIPYKSDPKLKQSQGNLIKSIEAGDYFRVQIELSVNPQLLHTKQKQNNNNLLHICVMNNKQQIFQMILRKSRDLSIDLLTQENKYGRTPIELGKILQFFKNNQLIDLLAIAERERRFGIYNLLLKNTIKKS